MVTQHKATGRAASLPSALAAGAAVSMLVTVIISTLGAWMITSGILPQEQIGYCAIAALLAATILGSITAMKRVKRKRIDVCLLNGGIYYCLLIAITIVFFDGGFQGMGVTFAVVMIGSLITLLPAGNQRKRNISRRIRKNRR